MNTRILASAFALCVANPANAQWTVVNLHPVGASSSGAWGVSGGQQVGYANVGGVNRASLWTGSSASWLLLSPAGSTASWGRGVSGGQQVGHATLGGINRASLWSGTAPSWVDLRPAGAGFSEASGVSGGQQVGWADVGGSYRASLWSGTAASWVDLHPAGAIYSAAYGIGGGQQVGSAFLNGVDRAILWSGTAASFVGLNPTGATQSAALAVHGGQQVGFATVGGTDHASLWTGTAASWVSLHPVGATESEARGVSGGQQVGYANVGGANRASLWTGRAATWVDLHAFLPANFSSSGARAIFRDGSGTSVVGEGFNTIMNRWEALMWLGPPPPLTFTLGLNKASVAGQNSVLGTITMSEARVVNTDFTTYDNTSLVTTPPSVTVLAGQLTRTFLITTMAVTSTVVTTIYAKRGTLTRYQTLTLAPLIPTAVVCTPSPVTGGQPTYCRVVINGPAGPGGRLIAIFDNSAYSTTPSTVTVAPGGTQVIFPITTIPVTSTKTVTVTARVSAGEKTGTFLINP